jgi:hypothetical protein
MPKKKGTPGGRQVQLSSEEYTKVLAYHQRTYDPSTDTSLTSDERKVFKKKAARFIVMDDEKQGGWPHGSVLFIKIPQQNAATPATVKLYVPQDKVESILGNSFYCYCSHC